MDQWSKISVQRNRDRWQRMEDEADRYAQEQMAAANRSGELDYEPPRGRYHAIRTQDNGVSGKIVGYEKSE